MVGYVYVTRTDEQVDKINATINKVNASINNFQNNSNHRWNVTFDAFNQVANAIDKVSDRLSYNQANNLNLTKYNRLGITDTNIMLHKIWENLTGKPTCEDNPLTECVDITKGRISSRQAPIPTPQQAPDQTIKSPENR